jgi:hypothetical protein
MTILGRSLAVALPFAPFGAPLAHAQTTERVSISTSAPRVQE